MEDAIDWIEYPGRIIYLASFFVALRGDVAAWGDRMDPSLRTFIERGSAFSLAELRESQLARTGLFRAVQALFTRYDFLLSPTLTRTALPADFDAAWGQVEVDGQECGITRQGWTSYCYPFNLTGHPAASFPSGWGADGLPTAVQVIGPWWSDESVLRLGAVLRTGPALGGSPGRLWRRKKGQGVACCAFPKPARAHRLRWTHLTV